MGYGEFCLVSKVTITNLSPVQSSAKCSGSDFSIERILSEDTRGRETSAQAPSWLCCTRYQPPRLPRVANACRARRSGRHARVPFTGTQAAALEAAYARAPYLAPPALRALAAALQLRDDRIKIWFQNRRARERREKSGIIAPPQAVTLPSTALSPAIVTNDALISMQNHPQATTFNGSYMRHTDEPLDLRECFNASGSNRNYHYQSFSSSSDESNDSRCDSPLDIETVAD